ncbi:hypothetical protein Pmani_034825 [Petrolisthes manimaculis]|uniref:Uncharacterized protein n=1 Tax=Petrolisthes manimaculis TaxID=1843537 RepID=A0AAE1NMX4_9EUCA|nr:hypothetical protein Pmani_034825 [Petrolisthes manimaculis]
MMTRWNGRIERHGDETGRQAGRQASREAASNRLSPTPPPLQDSTLNTQLTIHNPISTTVNSSQSPPFPTISTTPQTTIGSLLPSPLFPAS